MEEEHAKGPSHNNPEEAAEYVRSVTSLTDSFDMSIRGLNQYLRLDAWQTFIHGLSKLLLKLDSTYFTKLDPDVILDTIPDKACNIFLACPEEAAIRVQQRVSSDEIPEGHEVMSKLRLQNLPCFDKKGQKAVTRLFNCLQKAHSYLAEVANQVVMVSEVCSPEQFTFVLQHAVRPLIQLKIPPHLSAPTELRFQKERLTPEELNEENCCNLILPRPFHPKFAKLDTKDPTRCLAAAAHFLIRKKLFNSKVTLIHVAKDFAVAERKFHLAISGRKYDPGKKASKRKLTTKVKTADPQPSTSKAESASTQHPQAEPVSEQQPEDAPITEQQQERESGSTHKPKTIPLLHSKHMMTPLLHCNHKTNPFLNNENNTLRIHLHLYPAKTVIVHFQIIAHNSRSFTTKDPSSITKKPRYSLHPKPN